MKEIDIHYFTMMAKLGYVNEPFLEIGSQKVQEAEVPNLCEVSKTLGLKNVVGVDMAYGEGVDITFDFSIPNDQFNAAWKNDLFNTVAIFNVLEHTYDPITVLKNALVCVKPGGTLIALAPTIWSIHGYPKDYVRLLPDWFEEFGKRNDLTIMGDTFLFLSVFGMQDVNMMRSKSDIVFPSYINSGKEQSLFRYWTSRFIHKLFNTYGRNHNFTHCSIGCTFSKQE
ncbi:MAG: hypothetical protein M0Z67_06005 [Nitrospiraceae bacterium]|nr:hypothetical protein [Nitrospiraceae bacterium]